MSKRYYWLKLKKDFFKRHDIRIIEAMPNGKDYILFYLKLLVESVDHEGSLRFSETIPYNDEMLATITNTNVDIVRNALQVFTELKMIDILDDSTIYMNEVSKMIGSAADNDNAIRQQRFRDNQKALKIGVLESSVTKNNATVTECVTDSNESKSKSKSKELDIDLDRDNKLSLVQPKILSPEEKMFMEFWNAYPKKVDRKGCEKKFIKIKDLAKIFPGIMSALESQKQSKQWNEENGRFIPNPSTWINQERWNVVNEVAEKQIAIEEAVSDEVINDFTV